MSFLAPLGAVLIVLIVSRAAGQVTAGLLTALTVAVMVPDPFLVALSTVAFLMSLPVSAIRK